MSWDWETLSDAVRGLKLPAGEYAVGPDGYDLYRQRATTAKQVGLLVTMTGRKRLKERGWIDGRGYTVLTSRQVRGVIARIVEDDDALRQAEVIDDVPVVRAAPATTSAGPSDGLDWRTAKLGLMATLVFAVLTYGLSIMFSDADFDATIEHLAFRTTGVEATVESHSEVGTCSGAKVWDSSPRILVDLVWTDDGQQQIGRFEGCGADTDSPQRIWLDTNGEIASQRSPWMSHLWAGFAPGIVLFVFFVQPAFGWLRRRLQ